MHIPLKPEHINLTEAPPITEEVSIKVKMPQVNPLVEHVAAQEFARPWVETVAGEELLAACIKYMEAGQKNNASAWTEKKEASQNFHEARRKLMELIKETPAPDADIIAFAKGVEDTVRKHFLSGNRIYNGGIPLDIVAEAALKPNHRPRSEVESRGNAASEDTKEANRRHDRHGTWTRS